jgi:hypothetical protein
VPRPGPAHARVGCTVREPAGPACDWLARPAPRGRGRGRGRKVDGPTVEEAVGNHKHTQFHSLPARRRGGCAPTRRAGAHGPVRRGCAPASQSGSWHGARKGRNGTAQPTAHARVGWAMMEPAGPACAGPTRPGGGLVGSSAPSGRRKVEEVVRSNKQFYFLHLACSA